MSSFHIIGGRSASQSTKTLPCSNASHSPMSNQDGAHGSPGAHSSAAHSDTGW